MLVVHCNPSRKVFLSNGCPTEASLSSFCRYRLVPKVHFPEPFNDAFRAAKHFLQPDVLAKYSVDPGRIAISGDSAGGNLAAAVCQQVTTAVISNTRTVHNPVVHVGIWVIWGASSQGNLLDLKGHTQFAFFYILFLCASHWPTVN